MIVSFRGFMAMGFLITEIFPFLSPVVDRSEFGRGGKSSAKMEAKNKSNISNQNARVESNPP